MIGKLIKIASWVIEKYEGIANFVKTKYRIHMSKKIRFSVDSGNIKYITKLLRNIKKRRRDRRNAS